MKTVDNWIVMTHMVWISRQHMPLFGTDPVMCLDLNLKTLPANNETWIASFSDQLIIDGQERN